MHTPVVTIEVYDSIAPLVAEWNALAERAAAPPFAQAGWFTVWWEAFGVGAPVIVGARRGGRLVGVLALRRRGGVLASAANAHTPEFRMLVEDLAAARELAAWLFEQRPTRVQLDHVDAQDPALAALCRVAADARHRVLRTTVQRSPYVQFVAGEDVDRRMNGRAARNLRRNERRLRERGAVEFDVVDAARDLDALLIEGFPLEASGWKSQRGTAIVSSPVTERFYTGMAHWAHKASLLRLAFLRLDGRAIAFALCLRDRAACYLIKGGYDPGYRRFAPAKSLIRHLITRAAGEGAQRFEFLGAAETWKLEWTDRCHERLLVRIYAPTPLGNAERAAETVYLRYGKPLAKRALARVR
jgi:CelD/BcsL family acetyltransferase involved in cellulose biosynthesis